MEKKEKYFLFLDELLKNGKFNVSTACKTLTNTFEIVEEESMDILLKWIELRNKEICFVNKK
jgi:hypothetical protein